MFYDHIPRKWPEAACTLFFGAVHAHSIVRHKSPCREGTKLKQNLPGACPALAGAHRQQEGAEHRASARGTERAL